MCLGELYKLYGSNFSINFNYSFSKSLTVDDVVSNNYNEYILDDLNPLNIFDIRKSKEQTPVRSFKKIVDSHEENTLEDSLIDNSDSQAYDSRKRIEKSDGQNQMMTIINKKQGEIYCSLIEKGKMKISMTGNQFRLNIDIPHPDILFSKKKKVDEEFFNDIPIIPLLLPYELINKSVKKQRRQYFKSIKNN
jgi:hypothetical protein